MKKYQNKNKLKKYIKYNKNILVMDTTKFGEKKEHIFLKCVMEIFFFYVGCLDGKRN